MQIVVFRLLIIIVMSRKREKEGWRERRRGEGGGGVSSLYIACSLFATPNINRWTRAISHSPIHFHLSSAAAISGHMCHISLILLCSQFRNLVQIHFSYIKDMWICHVQGSIRRVCVVFHSDQVVLLFDLNWLSFVCLCLFLSVC